MIKVPHINFNSSINFQLSSTVPPGVSFSMPGLQSEWRGYETCSRSGSRRVKEGVAGWFEEQLDGHPLVQHTGCLLFIDLIELCGWGDADDAAWGPYTSWGPTLEEKITSCLSHRHHPSPTSPNLTLTLCPSSWFWSSTWIFTHYWLTLMLFSMSTV